MSNRYAIIDDTNTVINVILWDGVSAFNPIDVNGNPLTLVQSHTANIYDVWNGSEFIPGAPPEPTD